MEYSEKLGLLDENGKPLNSRIERALSQLLPRLRTRFSALSDEGLAADVLQEAARRLARTETRSGPIQKLSRYAWLTLHSVATSQMRRSSNRVLQRTVRTVESEEILASMPSAIGSPERIEQRIYLRELIDRAQLTDEEKELCTLKEFGYSSREIAKSRGCSVAAIDMLFQRVKAKIQRAANDHARRRTA